MPMSNVARGAYYKGRTKKWLIANGWQVADLERVQTIFTPKGRIGVKRDQFGSDLLAMSFHGLLFVQVKGGKTATGNFTAARRIFEEFQWPADVETPGGSLMVRRVVVAWTPGAREPRVVEM